MAALKWDEPGTRYFETGVSNVAIYPITSGVYGSGVAWNGVASINEHLELDDPEPLLDHGLPYFYSDGPGKISLSLSCYTYPESFIWCLGYESLALPWAAFTQAKRQRFGLAYKTKIGNDTELQDRGYKLHLYYGCLAVPAEEAQFATINDEVEPTVMNFTIYPSTFKMSGKTVTHLEFDSRSFEVGNIYKLERLVNYLFDWTDGVNAPTFPSSANIGTILSSSTYD